MLFPWKQCGSMRKTTLTIGLTILGFGCGAWSADTVQSRVGVYAIGSTASELGIDLSASAKVSSLRTIGRADAIIAMNGLGGVIHDIFGGIAGEIRTIYHGGTDWFNSTMPETIEWVTADVGGIAASVGPVTIGISSYVKEAYGQAVVDKIKDGFSARPEWFTDSPWWFDQVFEGYMGVSVKAVNMGIDVGLSATHGDFSMSNEMKAKIITAIVDEGFAYAKKKTLAAVTASTTPAFAILIDAAVIYGFDRVQDKVDDKISQHFAPGNPGVAEVQDAETQNQPIETNLYGGTVIPSVVISNYIQLGDPSYQKITIVSSPSKDHPSYYGAIGGEVRITGETMIAGEVRMIAVDSVKNLPSDFRSYSSEIITRTANGTPAVDNHSPILSING